jgi:D-aminoacyl-tRNA deacylase
VRAVVQRVSQARVTVAGRVTGEIAQGLLVLLGIAVKDQQSDADYILDKVLGLRIFEDADSKMNLSLHDSRGGLLVVSQFTLYGDTRRGKRPSFIAAASGSDAINLYEYFVGQAMSRCADVQTGEFGAMMDVTLTNDGPVTIILDSERTI